MLRLSQCFEVSTFHHAKKNPGCKLPATLGYVNCVLPCYSKFKLPRNNFHLSLDNNNYIEIWFWYSMGALRMSF